MSETGTGLVDWRLADRVARAVAGNGSGKRSVRTPDLRKAARGSVPLVRDYTGLETRGRLPSPEVVDRREWIAANMQTLRAITAVAERQLEQAAPPGLFASRLRGVLGTAAAVEVGVVSGVLAQRVLGQYDVALIGPARPPRLLFVAPNLAEAQRRLGADREPFLRWIALHEATHVVQFSSIPWLRDHIGGMGERLLETAFRTPDLRELVRMAGRLLPPDPRAIARAVREGRWLTPFTGGERLDLVRRLQTTMSVVEGYSEHVMDAIGADLDPAYLQMRDAMEERRSQRGFLETLLARLLGLEMKMRQYRQGKAFCDEVVERRGIETLNLVWSDPAALPRPGEIEQPGRWLARVA